MLTVVAFVPEELPTKLLFQRIVGLLEDWEFTDEELALAGLTGDRRSHLERVLFGLEVSVQNCKLRDGVAG